VKKKASIKYEAEREREREREREMRSFLFSVSQLPVCLMGEKCRLEHGKFKTEFETRETWEITKQFSLTKS